MLIFLSGQEFPIDSILLRDVVQLTVGLYLAKTITHSKYQAVKIHPVHLACDCHNSAEQCFGEHQSFTLLVS